MFSIASEGSSWTCPVLEGRRAMREGNAAFGWPLVALFGNFKGSFHLSLKNGNDGKPWEATVLDGLQCVSEIMF